MSIALDFSESLFLVWVCAPLNYWQWCWWGVADGPFLLMLYGEEWLRINCKTWQLVRLLNLMPLCVWLWIRWLARLHCWIFCRRCLLGRSVRLIASMLVFLRGRMYRSVLKESYHLQCIIFLHCHYKLHNQGVGDMLLLFLLFHFLVLTQYFWVREINLSLHNVNNKLMCWQFFELVWFLLMIIFLMCKSGWIVFLPRTRWVCVCGVNQLIQLAFYVGTWAGIFWCIQA